MVVGIVTLFTIVKYWVMGMTRRIYEARWTCSCGIKGKKWCRVRDARKYWHRHVVLMHNGNSKKYKLKLKVRKIGAN